MALRSILISLITLATFIQPTVQHRVLEWEVGEEESFTKNAKAHIKRLMKPYSLKSVAVNVVVKCAGRRNSPYGITIRTFKTRGCNCVKCLCACCGTGKKGEVECQFAARTGSVSFLGLMCYWKRGDAINGAISKESICEKWLYPGTDTPQLQVPEYLKSPYSEPLAYVPPQKEKRDGSWPFSNNTWPTNVHERTGFGGIGSLETLGPNRILYFVIVSRRGRDVEMVVEPGAGELALPQFFAEDGNVGEQFLVRCVRRLRLEMGVCSENELTWVIQNKEILHMGYLKHRLNTDNAWLEGAVVKLDGDYANCFGLPSDRHKAQNGRYSWVPLPMRGSGSNDYLSPVIAPLIANYK